MQGSASSSSLGIYRAQKQINLNLIIQFNHSLTLIFLQKSLFRSNYYYDLRFVNAIQLGFHYNKTPIHLILCIFLTTSL